MKRCLYHKQKFKLMSFIFLLETVKHDYRVCKQFLTNISVLWANKSARLYRTQLPNIYPFQKGNLSLGYRGYLLVTSFILVPWYQAGDKMVQSIKITATISKTMHSYVRDCPTRSFTY